VVLEDLEVDLPGARQLLVLDAPRQLVQGLA
jgi:hypothetical protein